MLNIKSVTCPCCSAIDEDSLEACPISENAKITLDKGGRWYAFFEAGPCEGCGCRFDMFLGSGGWEVQSHYGECEEAKKRGFLKKLGPWSGGGVFSPKNTLAEIIKAVGADDGDLEIRLERVKDENEGLVMQLKFSYPYRLHREDLDKWTSIAEEYGFEDFRIEPLGSGGVEVRFISKLDE